MPTEKWVNYMHDTFRGMWHVPIAFITGQTGKNVKALLNHSQMLYKQSLQRVATSDLNKLLRAAIEANPPPIYHNRTAEDLFRHASWRAAADDRAVLRQPGGHLANVPAIFAGRVSRSAAVFRSADQALSAPARRARQTAAGRGGNYADGR